MDVLTIRQGDKHDVRLEIGNSPIDLSGGSAEVHVQPSLGGTVQSFNATVGANNVIIWPLDGTLLPGKYLLEVEITVGLSIVTAPSNKNITLIVLDELA